MQDGVRIFQRRSHAVVEIVALGGQARSALKRRLVVSYHCLLHGTYGKNQNKHPLSSSIHHLS